MPLKESKVTETGVPASPGKPATSKYSEQAKQTPSLNLADLDEPEKKTEEKDVPLFGQDEFTEEHLYKVWDEYFEKKKGGLADIESMVLRKKPVLRDNSVLELVITNGVEINILKKMEEDLLRFLRTELNNGQISIKHIIAVEETKEKLYTDTDKFNDMAKRNPVLLELKNRLGLDTEY